MPEGAKPLGEYVRYYYSETSPTARTVVGMYVDKQYLEWEKISVPATGVVIVASSNDVPAPYDAGCEVVTVTYAPENPATLKARCDSELSVPLYVDGSGEILRFTVVVGLLL